ncbi:MAG: hypothetical protein IJ400_06910 [Clostridia bacterium]|nr:hypothetical protein [Clostridia bacterium]
MSEEQLLYLGYWLTFLAEIICLVAIVVFLIIAFRYLRAIYKRSKFLARLIPLDVREGVVVKKITSQYGSIFCNTKKVDIIVETKEKRYVIKYFTPSVIKNINLFFITPNRYFITNVKGYTLLLRNVGFIIFARMFKPKRIEETFLRMTHNEIYEVVKGEKHLPTIDFDSYSTKDKITENVLMVNPIPLNIKYINKNRFEPLLSGDEYESFKIFSTDGFLKQLDRETD